MADQEFTPILPQDGATEAWVRLPAGKYVVSEAIYSLGSLDHDSFWKPLIDQPSVGGIRAGAWAGRAAAVLEASEMGFPLSAPNSCTALNGLIGVVSIDLLKVNGVDVEPLLGKEINLGNCSDSMREKAATNSRFAKDLDRGFWVGGHPYVEVCEGDTLTRRRLAADRLELDLAGLIVDAKA
ncbi:hypothetical protein [Nocardioides sp. Root140]|uniref:hypothetical protein n=1 Tax=Nocardioides sp. Root140 TaxID=1736460 RepID=UPI0006FF1E04|nr:hypothetical protein [Nocardioides sp. Root140]KQY61844.1 hypothetical protein ASD30_25210 [Nocardioides sp. Root140]